MNERISIVSDTKVVITRNEYGFFKTELTLLDDGCVNQTDYCEENKKSDHDIKRWDAQGRAALRDCINCFDSTGSFAALADTSPVPFCGKRMRWQTAEDGIHEVTIVRCHVGSCRVVSHRYDRQFEYLPNISTLLPLTEPAHPKPTYRPYTPVEAAAHLGRGANGAGNRKPWSVGAVSRDYLRIEENGLCVSYESFAKEWKWADNGEPCGIEVTPTT